MNYCEERLDREKHFIAVGDFKSGADEPLDMFFSDYSFEYDEQGYGKTYILKADDIVQKTIGESFNEKCDLYVLSL